MLAIDQLMAFYVAIVNDKGITTSHISLYMALFKCWNLNNNQNPVPISRQEIMLIAKINGQATYHKCMKELQDLGYIKYRPSYHPKLGSQVYLNKLDLD